MLQLVSVILALYAINMLWTGSQHGLTAIAMLGVGFAITSIAVFLKKSWSKWLVLGVCLLYIAGGVANIWVFYENAGRFLTTKRAVTALLPGVLMMLLMVIVPVLTFWAFRKRES